MDTRQNRVCATCGDLKHRNSFKPGAVACMLCQKQARMESNDYFAEIDKKNMKVLEALADSGGATLPHVTELVQALYGCFGGVDGFAKQLFAQYLASDPGSAGRQRLLQSIIAMTVEVSRSGHATPKLEHMTEADLLQEMGKLAVKANMGLLNEFVSSKGGAVVDALPAKIEAQGS